ncbi:MAG: hypothetical protein C4531_02370 [Desulfurivibrio sp.]|nr:MAG: hypothetical protein C4531_02370 [Desulfurivibrio sp.]
MRIKNSGNSPDTMKCYRVSIIIACQEDVINYYCFTTRGFAESSKKYKAAQALFFNTFPRLCLFMKKKLAMPGMTRYKSWFL